MRQRLYEIDFCRALATIVLVYNHTFAPYTGAWSIPVENVPAYMYIGKIAAVVNLCLFVFISGYVHSYQEEVKSYIDKRGLIRKKFQRLIVPALFWGVLYCCIFGGSTISLKGMFELLSGVGHLWFLPMLFWVFVFFLLIQKTKLGHTLLLPVFAVSIITPNIMSLGVLSALHYLVWFYVGYYFCRCREKIPSVSFFYIAFLFFAFIVIYVSYVEVHPILNTLRDMGVFFKMVFQTVEHAILFPRTLIGIAVVYLIARRICSRYDLSGKNGSRLGFIIQQINKYSMGIYIFHDFVLEILYRYTDFLSSMHLYAPWLAFIIAITLSYIAAIIVSRIPYLRKTI